MHFLSASDVTKSEIVTRGTAGLDVGAVTDLTDFMTTGLSQSVGRYFTQRKRWAELLNSTMLYMRRMVLHAYILPRIASLPS